MLFVILFSNKAGFYQDEIGSPICKTCIAGYLCDAGTTYPTAICPLGKYCPAGSDRGHYCRNGTYGEFTSLVSQSECTICPASFYCASGNIVGQCSAGYFCKIGQGTSTPAVDTYLWPSNQDLLYYLYGQDGGPCYPGYYCPPGTSNPFPCSNGTVRADAYGDSQQSCGPCPGGYTCKPGNPVPIPCNKVNVLLRKSLLLNI